MSLNSDIDYSIATNPNLFGAGQSLSAATSLFSGGAGNMIGLPPISAGGGSAGAAVSGGGNVYHGDIKTGVNVFVFIGALIFVGVLAVKVARK